MLQDWQGWRDAGKWQAVGLVDKYRHKDANAGKLDETIKLPIGSSIRLVYNTENSLNFNIPEEIAEVFFRISTVLPAIEQRKEPIGYRDGKKKNILLPDSGMVS